jgi:hypothetical protein
MAMNVPITTEIALVMRATTSAGSPSAPVERVSIAPRGTSTRICKSVMATGTKKKSNGRFLKVAQLKRSTELIENSIGGRIARRPR